MTDDERADRGTDNDETHACAARRVRKHLPTLRPRADQHSRPGGVLGCSKRAGDYLLGRRHICYSLPTRRRRGRNRRLPGLDRLLGELPRRSPRAMALLTYLYRGCRRTSRRTRQVRIRSESLLPASRKARYAQRCLGVCTTLTMRMQPYVTELDLKLAFVPQQTINFLKSAMPASAEANGHGGPGATEAADPGQILDFDNFLDSQFSS